MATKKLVKRNSHGSAPAGAVWSDEKNAWVTKKSGTVLESTGNDTKYSWYARGKDGKAYFFDPQTGMFTARKAY